METYGLSSGASACCIPVIRITYVIKVMIDIVIVLEYIIIILGLLILNNYQ